MTETILNVSNLSVSFITRNGRDEAVKNMSFSLRTGETLGIVGESGSGKSVTCYSMLGLIPRPPGKIESGNIHFEGKDLLSLSERELQKIRGDKIAMIFQDPMTSLNPFITIGAQITEALQLHHKMSKRLAREKACLSLHEVGIHDAEKRLNNYPHEFSGGMRQRVMIAMALATEPDIIIADEPTTALDVTIQAQILSLLKSIQAKRNLGIIFISHDLAVVKNIADQVLVMKQGEVVESGSPQVIFEAPQHPYTQALINAIPKTAKVSFGQGGKTPIIEAKNVSKHYQLVEGPPWAKQIKQISALDNVSLSIYKGEILGLVGESGSGKSTLGKSLIRLIHPDSGEIIFEGENILEYSKKSLRQFRQSVQMVFQDPYASLNPRMTIFDTLAEPIVLHKLVDHGDVARTVDTLLDDVGLDRRSARKYPHEFSGGQRQRIAIARAIASGARVLIADEPVSALDVTIQAQVLDLMLSLAREREISMLFISHDLSVVRYMCDRVAVMQTGKIIELGDTEEVFRSARHSYTKSLLAAIPTVATTAY